MRAAPLLLLMLLGAAPVADAQVRIGIGLPSVDIGIHLGGYPRLVRVPGYPVYYADDMDSNFFFYDGLYWVFEDDDWYASSWYDGPWDRVSRGRVPVYVLRVPVSYYRHAPRYFNGWRRDAPPRWGERWGRDWQRQRDGWDRWDRSRAPAPAPLPSYQRQYGGDRYPRAEPQRRELEQRNYRYQPTDPNVRDRRNAQPQRPAAPQAQPAPPRTQPAAPRNDPRGNDNRGNNDRNPQHDNRDDSRQQDRNEPGRERDRKNDKPKGHTT